MLMDTPIATPAKDATGSAASTRAGASVRTRRLSMRGPLQNAATGCAVSAECVLNTLRGGEPYGSAALHGHNARWGQLFTWCERTCLCAAARLGWESGLRRHLET